MGNTAIATIQHKQENPEHGGSYSLPIETIVDDDKLEIHLKEQKDRLNQPKRELIEESDILNRADALLSKVRERYGELRNVLTPDIQEELIYSNPEIFMIMEYMNIYNLNPDHIAILINQFQQTIELPYGGKVIFGGSGWGLTARALSKIRPDLLIYDADINPDIVSMDKATNQRQGFTGITSFVCDFTDINQLAKIFEQFGRMDIASVGLLRYLSPEERFRMVSNLLKISPHGTSFITKEVNLESMNSLTNILKKMGIPHYVATEKRNHFKFTRLFGLYAMYKGNEALVNAMKEIDPSFDFELFKDEIDRISHGYSHKREIPNIDPQAILGDEYYRYLDPHTPTSLNHLLVLMDLAGYDTHVEEIVIFKK